MAQGKPLTEMFDIVSGFVPVDMQTTANNGDWVSMANYDHCAVVLFKGVGNANDDPTLTLQQATDNAGAGAKDITKITDIYVKQNTVLTAAAEGIWTLVTQTAATNYTDATSAEDQAIWVINLDASNLDVNNGFNHIQGNVADVGGNPQLGCVFYIMWGNRYPQAIPVSAIT